MSEQLTDPAALAAYRHAELVNCVCVQVKRGRWFRCSYHEGYEDGFDEAIRIARVRQAAKAIEGRE